MVKIGFIAEGETEQIVLKSESFKQFLEKNNIQYVPQIIDATGSGNLLPKNIQEFKKTLINQGATVICIVTDQSPENICITGVKDRIIPSANDFVFVAVKQIESWFLADSDTISKIFQERFSYSNPETPEYPYDVINNLRIEKRKRGFGSKVKCAFQMINNGFSIENSAQHVDCPSAKYFLNRIIEISRG